MDSPAAIAAQLAGDDVGLFGSDLHLSADDPATLRLVLESLDEHAAGCTHLFLLGDLFDAWVGDDAPDEAADALLSAFGSLAARGVAVFAMRGNRDFLLGTPPPGVTADPLGAHGARLLDDPCVVDLFGVRTLLTHGDALCTDDADYQAFRIATRSPEWQREFLSRPLAERQRVATGLRGESELAKGAKAPSIMDVNARACVDAVRSNAAARLIHGHTHRPASHATPIERWVLPDWDAQRGRGGWLRVDARGARRVGPWGERATRPSG